MRVLGIAAATIAGATGYGCIIAEPNVEPRYIACGIITPPKNWSFYGRLGEILKEMDDVLDELQPDVVALELADAPSDIAAAAAAMMLPGARAVCGAAAARRRLSVSEYTPATIKRAACGSSGATSEQVRAVVVVRLKMTKDPDPSASDALAVALTHYQMAVGRPFRKAPGTRETP